MADLVALDNVAHHDLKVALRHGAAFGDAVNQMLVFASEFEEAQREFPILFRRDPAEGLQAMALLGLDRDENLFLERDRWTSRYIPAIQQRGPFSIGLASGSEPKIHVDLDDPRVDVADGLPMFLPHGGNGPYLDLVGRVLRTIYAGLELGGPLYAAWDALGLIRPMMLEVMLDEEKRYAIEGFEGVSQERLAALSGDELERLHRAGHLSPLFLVLASLGNIPRLIERKKARLAA